MTTITQADFNISIANGKTTITRDFAFKGGDSITFTVALENDKNATVVDLHKQSVARVMALLQELITPE